MVGGKEKVCILQRVDKLSRSKGAIFQVGSEGEEEIMCVGG